MSFGFYITTSRNTGGFYIKTYLSLKTNLKCLLIFLTMFKSIVENIILKNIIICHAEINRDYDHIRPSNNFLLQRVLLILLFVRIPIFFNGSDDRANKLETNKRMN